MTIANVKAKAKELDIKSGKMTKDELIKQIQRQEGNFDCFGTASDNYCDQSDCSWRDDCLG
ncbi:MAG: SAP domain-containing protein [bacterium]|nr:SAP domain-containing protein [bacterium]